MSTENLAEDCLVKLREYVAGLGGSLDGEWKCRAQMRDTGSRAGSIDMWFRAPTGEVYRSKVAVARGLGLLEPAEPPAPRAPKEGMHTRKPRHVPPDGQPVRRRARSPPYTNDLTPRDLAELLLSMQDSYTMDGRYQGRLAWKGTANIRNPAIAIALEMLLGAYRKPRPPVEPAPAMPGVVGTDPLVLPVRVSTHIPNPGSDEPHAVLEYELPAGALGPQEPAVTAELEVQQGDEERPVRLVLSPTQRPLALMTIPVVQAEGELPRPLGIISALLPPLGEGCEDGEAAQQQDEADEDEELSGEPGSGGSSEGEEMRAAPAAARGEEEEEGAHGESSEMSGELEGEAGEGSEEGDDMEVDEDNPPDSPTSSLDVLDEGVADALLGLPDALPPMLEQHEKFQQEYESAAAAAPVAAAAAAASPAPGSLSPSLRPPRPSSESLRGKTPEEVEVALMERLRRYVHDLGHELPEGWTVKASVRKSGVSAGGIDAYYYAPGGKRCKSMVKVAEALGIGVPSPAKAAAGGGSAPSSPCITKPRKRAQQAAAGAANAAAAAVPLGGLTGLGLGSFNFGAFPGLPFALPQFPPSPQPSTQSPAFLSPEIEQPLDFTFALPPVQQGGGELGTPQQLPQPLQQISLAELMQAQQAVLAGAGGLQLPLPEEPEGLEVLYIRQSDPEQQQAVAGPAVAAAAGALAEAPEAPLPGQQAPAAGPPPVPLSQQPPQQLRQELPLLNVSDVQRALEVVQSGKAPPLRAVRLPGQAGAAVGRLGRRDQLLAGRKRRRSELAAAGAPDDSGGDSSSSDEGEEDDREASSSGAASASASDDEGSLPGAPPGRRPVSLPGGTDAASLGQQRQQGENSRPRRERKSRKEWNEEDRSKGKPDGGGGSRQTGGGGGGGSGGDGSKGGPGKEDGKGSGKGHKRRRPKKAVDPDKPPTNNYDRMFNRLRSQLSRLRQEQALVEAYAADGWRGASREKVKPLAEIKRAKEQIQRCKESIRKCVRYCDEAEGDRPIPAELFDETGELDLDHIFCSKCKLNHASDDNDIILCDGPCNRAYHVQCLVPPVDPEALPEDEGWLCPACDRKCDMVDLINDEFGTEYELETPWETILDPATIPKSPNAAAGVPGSPRGAMVDLGRLEGLLQGADLPSEDEEDEDYVGSESDEEDGAASVRSGSAGGSGAAEAGSDGEAGGGGSDSDSEGGSLASEDLEGMLDDDAEVQATRRSSRKRAGTASGEELDGASGQRSGSSSEEGEGEEEEALILNHKRRRAVVDYRALHQEMFGPNEGLEGELEEEEEEDEVWSPRKQQRRGGRRGKAGAREEEVEEEEEGDGGAESPQEQEQESPVEGGSGSKGTEVEAGAAGG